MNKLIALVMLAVSFGANASSIKFNDTQMDNLQYAYRYGEQFTKKGVRKELDDTKRGLGFVMAGIAWQESSAGINLSPKKNHHAYGMFQNYIKTVRAKKEKRGVKMSDREIIKKISKRDVSADYAIDELSYWLKVRKGNMRLALASYNAGWDYKKGLGYADSVLRKANYLKRNVLKDVE